MGPKEISEKEAEGKKDSLKEIRDIKKEERERTVEDKESIGSISSQLEFTGFSEAGEQIRGEVRSSAEATEKRFEEQDKETISEVFDPQRDHEKELGERRSGIESDIGRIASENLTTDTAQDRLKQAESAAERGKEKVEKLKDQQEQERVEGEKQRDEQKGRKDSVTIDFKT